MPDDPEPRRRGAGLRREEIELTLLPRVEYSGQEAPGNGCAACSARPPPPSSTAADDAFAQCTTAPLSRRRLAGPEWVLTDAKWPKYLAAYFSAPKPPIENPKTARPSYSA
ncbi:hypothetical protein HNR23_001750 [Nocardiopsis mwathae]|uniref:Uncharacterized protein n=1 Tax=Nocardiopsis mwathae TaxID=1472723 RepID=A0A7W9YGT4_9ACTN|nr:hypothetical protein [Nocardiopsis mwathae]MBB6171690.1 hypothetical protein [Nocardiopsis mwathae]